MPVEEWARMAEIDTERADLKSQQDALTKERFALEEILLAEAEEGVISKMKVGGRTVFVRHETWAGAAKGVEKADAIQALKDAGLGGLITENWNHQTLSAWARNDLPQTIDGMPIVPDALEGFIHVASKSTIRSNKSS